MIAPTIETVEKKLDTLYETDISQYIELKKTVKDMGFKVYKNGANKHRIKQNENYLNEVFGGVFK